MSSLKSCKIHYRLSVLSSPSNLQNIIKQTQTSIKPNKLAPRRKLSLSIRGCSGQEKEEEEGKKSSQRRTFLTLEEAGLVEISGLSTHERFLCRLTVFVLQFTFLINCLEFWISPRLVLLRLTSIGSVFCVFLMQNQISSLNLLRVIAEQEGCSIEELNAGRVCDWFVKDKLRREQNIDSAVLRWDDSESPFWTFFLFLFFYRSLKMIWMIFMINFFFW